MNIGISMLHSPESLSPGAPKMARSILAARQTREGGENKPKPNV
jgi:hypothetical protein